MRCRNAVSLIALLILIGVVVFIVQINMRNAARSFTHEDAPIPLNLKINESFIIKLEENPAEGYTWHCIIDNEEVIILESNYFQPFEEDNAAISAPGIRNFRFRAVKSGTATITFQSYKEWEVEDVAETCAFSILVE